MKDVVSAILAALVAATVTGREMALMVNEHGRLNSTNAVATVADLAAAAAAALVADAKSEAATAATAAGTNMIAGVVGAIAASELVVYARGRVSAFEAGALFGPDDEIGIYDFKVQGNADGTMTAQAWWFSTVPIGNSDVYFKWADSLTNKVFVAVDADSNVPLGTQTAGSKTYQNAYLMSKTFDSMPKSFFKVGLDPDAPAGDGAMMDIKGVVNGFTGVIYPGEGMVVSNGVTIGKVVAE